MKQARILQLGIDMEAWNNYFRDLMFAAFGREILDAIFGVSFFEKTMTSFILSCYYHVSGDGNVYTRKGQEGGIKGLAQKIWSWIYVTVGNPVVENLRYSCKSMVNRDDLRMAICIPAYPPTRRRSSAVSWNK